MKKLVYLEITRVRRNYVALLCGILTLLIGAIGLIINRLLYQNLNDVNTSVYCLYNSYSQFSYLILSPVLVNIFSKDFEDGTYQYLEQMGYSLRKIIASKCIIMLLLTIPIINIVFGVLNIFYQNFNLSYFIECMLVVNINICFLILLALFISMIVKKVIQSTLLMYGLYLLLNVINLIMYGLTNPADSNSLSTYYFGKVVNPNVTHNSLDRLSLKTDTLERMAIIMPSIWCVIILGLCICLVYRKEKNPHLKN